jgi:3-oxoacyl-[acyl-carrier protein] reductase
LDASSVNSDRNSAKSDDRVAIVTGGGSGIGAATARMLAVEGQTVALVGRRAEPLAAVVSEIEATGGSAFPVSADLAERGAPWEIVEAVLARTGRIDVIVNNAASFRLELIDDFTLEDFENHVAVNIRAAYFLVQAALPSLRASPSPAVVNVSSAAAAMYRRRQTLYGLTKAALEHMTKNMAAELAPERIRVNCIRPGPVATEIHTAVADPAARLAELGRLVPLGRVGEPEEIALWIRHLVDREAEWVTGSVLVIDGGRVLGPPEV